MSFAGDDLGPGALVVGQAVLPHHAGDRLFVHGERAAEAAALVGPGQLDQLDAPRARRGAAGPC